MNLDSDFVKGREYEDEYINTSLLVKKCLGSNCKNDNEIAETINNLVLEFFYLNTNFDGSNVETPILGYLDMLYKEGIEDNSYKLRLIEF